MPQVYNMRHQHQCITWASSSHSQCPVVSFG